MQHLTTAQKTAAALGVECPQCHAPAGQICTEPPPVAYKPVHLGRRDAVLDSNGNLRQENEDRRVVERMAHAAGMLI